MLAISINSESINIDKLKKYVVRSKSLQYQHLKLVTLYSLNKTQQYVKTSISLSHKLT